MCFYHHLSDISWNLTGEEAVRNYKKGDEVEAIILSIDPERERISLGIKQMEGDPQANYLEANPKGNWVKGKITEVEAKGAKIDLGEGIEGYLKSSELGSEKVDDARTRLTSGETIEARIVGLDRKTRSINLSLKTKELQTEDSSTETSA